jgi:hypothetical protein
MLSRSLLFGVRWMLGAHRLKDNGGVPQARLVYR